jgi:hypothetical protein
LVGQGKGVVPLDDPNAPNKAPRGSRWRGVLLLDAEYRG